MGNFFNTTKNRIEQLKEEEHKGLRKALLCIASIVGVLMSFLLLFINFLFYKYRSGEIIIEKALSPIRGLSLLSNGPWLEGIVVTGLILFIVCITLFVIQCILIGKVFIASFHNREEKMLKHSKIILIIATASTGLYTLASSVAVSIINSISEEAALSHARNAFPFILLLIVDSIFAIYSGLMYPKESEVKQVASKQDRTLKSIRLELFIYTIIIGFFTLLTIFSNIITVDFTKFISEKIKISGWEFLTDYASLEKGRIISYILLVAVVLFSTMFILAIFAYLGKSPLFYKLSLTSIVICLVCSLTIGLFGQSYQVVQGLNEDLIVSILIKEGLHPESIPSLTYKVTSNSIYFFFGCLVIVILLIIRRPYSKGLALDGPLQQSDNENVPVKSEVTIAEVKPQAASNAAFANTSTQGVSGKPTPLADPCPAFTELDDKQDVFKQETEARQQQLFSNLTLPKLVRFIVDYARNSRLHLSYTEEDIATFIAGLGTTKLSILQGMSGTGKTSLPKIFTEALYSKCEIIEVESSWRDKNELLGYYNEFSKMYTPKKFTQALYRAALNPDVLTLIVLDEMNLSRIEYYFSDFLSLMENEPEHRKLKLLNVPLYRTENGTKIPYAALEDGHTLPIPPNVWFIGTANRDESTFEISDKVYDRAHTMNFNKRATKVSYSSDPLEPFYVPASELTRLFEDAKNTFKFNIDVYPAIAQVEQLLAPYNISFGNRIAMQIESFVSIYCSCFSLTEAVIHDAVEKILFSKVVSKLELKSVENKEELAFEFEKIGFTKCSEFIRQLNED